MAATETAVVVSDRERRAILDRDLVAVASRGYRMESRSEFQATVVRGKPPSHVLHLLLSLVTLGLWLIVWALVALGPGEERFVLVVDERGHLTGTRVRSV